MIPGSAEWRDKVVGTLREEASRPMRCWYLSFSDIDGWRGGCVVEARGPASAMARTDALGINPGGEVAMWELPDGQENDIPHDRLLSKAELGDDPERITT